MKKDKKWFIDKWTKERDKTSIHEPMYYFINDFITDVKELDEPEVLSKEWIDEHATAVTYDEILDQTEIVYVDDLENLIIPKEESEVTLDRAFEEVSKSYPMTKEETWRHLEQIVAHGGKVTYGEPEVLSQEWIDKNKFEVNGWNEAVHVEDLQNLLVPKQEELESKIKVLIEAYKQEDGAYSNPENGWISGFVEDLENLVEEEPLYYALIKGHELINNGKIYWNYVKSDGSVLISEPFRPTNFFLSEMTKAEWNEIGINDSNADFVKA